MGPTVLNNSSLKKNKKIKKIKKSRQSILHIFEGGGAPPPQKCTKNGKDPPTPPPSQGRGALGKKFVSLLLSKNDVLL